MPTDNAYAPPHEAPPEKASAPPVPEPVPRRPPGFVGTALEVGTKPSTFFARAADQRSRWAPIAFAAGVGAAVGVGKALSLVVAGASIGAISRVLPPAVLTWTLLGVFQAFLSSLFAHGLLSIGGARKASLAETFGGLAFARGPAALGVVPVVGEFVGEIWALGTGVIALERTHGLRRRAAVLVMLGAIAASLLFAMLQRSLGFEALKVPSYNMAPTLVSGDRLFLARFAYGYGAQLPARGDVISFWVGGGEVRISRVIGLPGERIEVRAGHVTIDGEPLPTKPLGEQILDDHGDPVPEGGTRFDAFEETLGAHRHVAMTIAGRATGREGVWTVEPGHVFLLGDSRDNSADSRFGREIGGPGQVAVDHIVGRASLIWLSLGGPEGVRAQRMGTFVE